MYRDFRVAHFIYHEKAGYFHQQGIEQFVAAPGTPSHAKYLERMKFQLKDGMYVLKLGAEVMKDIQL
jgi:hypothetical protein